MVVVRSCVDSELFVVVDDGWGLSCEFLLLLLKKMKGGEDDGHCDDDGVDGYHLR